MDYKEITSHKIACKVLKKDPKASPKLDDQLVDIANAINKVTKFNPKKAEKVWRPYFYHDRSDNSFGFSYSGYGYRGSDSVAGSRLCFNFKDEPTADFFGKQFLAMHKKLFFQK